MHKSFQSNDIVRGFGLAPINIPPSIKKMADHFGRSVRQSIDKWAFFPNSSRAKKKVPPPVSCIEPRFLGTPRWGELRGRFNGHERICAEHLLQRRFRCCSGRISYPFKHLVPNLIPDRNRISAHMAASDTTRAGVAHHAVQRIAQCEGQRSNQIRLDRPSMLAQHTADRGIL